MPLEHGKSKAAFQSNLKTELKAGKPKAQALAIAYSEKRKAGGHAAEGAVEPLPEDLGHVVGLSKRGLPLVSLGSGHHVEVHPRGLDKEQGAQYAEHLAKMLPHHDDIDEQLEHAAKGMVRHAAGGETPVVDTSAVDTAAEEQPIYEAAARPQNREVVSSGEPPDELDQAAADIAPDRQWGTPNPSDSTATSTPVGKGPVDMYGNPDLQASAASDSGPVRGMSHDNPDYEQWKDVEPWMKSEGERQALAERGKTELPENPFAEPNEPGSKEDIAAKETAVKKAAEPKPQDELDKAAAELAAVGQEHASPGVPAPSAEAPAGSAYNNAVKAIESGGNPNAKNQNPGATAEGLYGFTDDTWKRLGMAGKNKRDVNNQEEAMRRLTAENSRTLKTNDPIKLYAAHNSGPKAVQDAEAAASAAGHPDQWLNYLVTPTGKGNPDPEQGKKAVRAFAKAFSKQAQASTPTASAPQASAGGGSGPLAAQEMLAKMGYGATDQFQPTQGWAEQAVSALSNPGPAPARAPITGGGGKMSEFAPVSTANTDVGLTPSGGETSQNYTPAEAPAAETPPVEVPPAGNTPEGANFTSATGEEEAAPAPSQADMAAQAPQPEAPQSPVDQAIAEADERARQIAEQTGIANQAGMKEAEQQGILGKYEMAAHQELADKLGQSIDDFQKSQNLVQAQAQQQMQAYHNAYQHLAQTRIDPSQWWSSRNAGQKFMGILGVLVSGFSGTQNNAGMDVIQKNIERDIDAQKANYGIQRDVADSKKSLFQMNMENFKNKTAAETATQAMLWQKTAQQLAAQAAQASGPIASSKAQQAAAEANVRSIALQGQAHQQALQGAEQVFQVKDAERKMKMWSALAQGNNMDPGTYNSLAESAGYSMRKVAGIPELEGRTLPKEVAASISKEIQPIKAVSDDIQAIQDIRDKYPIAMHVPGVPIDRADAANLVELNKQLNADYIRASEGEDPSSRTLGKEALGRITPDVTDADWFWARGTSGPIETLKLRNDKARGRLLEKYGYPQPHA